MYQTEQATMPNTDHDHDDQDKTTSPPTRIHEDFQNGQRIRSNFLKVSNAEQEGYQHEKSDNRRAYDSEKQTERSVSDSLAGFLAQMRRRVKAKDGILSHQHTTDGHICRRSTNSPADILRCGSCSIVECPEDESGGLQFGGFGEDGNGDDDGAEAVESHGSVDEEFESLDTQ